MVLIICRIQKQGPTVGRFAFLASIDENAKYCAPPAVADPMLQQQMKNRHLQMIAVGGSIGTGLFIGSGE